MHVSFFELPGAQDELQLSLISFERHVSYDKLASILYDEYRLSLQSVDAIILRPAVDRQVHDTSKEDGVNMIIERFPHIPVYLLYSIDYEIRFSENLNSAVESDTEGLKSFSADAIINHLRQKELEDFIEKSASILRCPENTIYRTPSNEYSHVFVRVGNIQTNRYVLDAIFFWTIPYLKNAGSILTDSWSISSIALNISRLLCRYDKTVQIEKFHVNMLATHYGGGKKLDSETENNLYALAHENKKDILFLISAVKTLKSLNNLKKVFEDLKIVNKLEYLALYKLIAANDTTCLCDLSGDFCIQQTISFDSYPQPPKKEEVIEIDDKIFFPMQIKETEVWIRKYCTNANEAFFRKYEGKNVLYVHRDSYYLGKDRFRHHGIYVDVSRMLLCSDFRSAVQAAVHKMEQVPSLIIYPPHAHGKDLVDAVRADLSNKFGKDVEAVDVLDINFLSRSISDPLVKKLSSLGPDALIMVIDDVSTTGSRLKNYQKKLRYAYRGQIHYFIGVARPENEAVWRKRIKDLVFRPGAANHIVTSIEKVFLPDWDEKACPWCTEKEIINKVASKPVNAKYPLTRSLKSRYFKLQGKVDGGLQDDVFFSINSNPKPLFQGGSVFAGKKEISESDLVSIVAAALQDIRNNGGVIDVQNTMVKFETQYPHFKIFNIADYMGQNASFNEALVKAVVLRTASRSELHAKTESNRNRQIDEVENFFARTSIEKHEVCFFIYEVFLAIKDAKLPKPQSGIKLLKTLEEAYHYSPEGEH